MHKIIILSVSDDDSQFVKAINLPSTSEKSRRSERNVWMARQASRRQIERNFVSVVLVTNSIFHPRSHRLAEGRRYASGRMSWVTSSPSRTFNILIQPPTWREATRCDATCPCYFVQRSDGRQTDVDENSYVGKTNRQSEQPVKCIIRSIYIPGMCSKVN